MDPKFVTSFDGARRLQRGSVAGSATLRTATRPREALRRGWQTMKLDKPIDAYIKYLETFGGRGKGASPHTLRVYRGDLKLFLGYIKSVRGQRAGDLADFDQDMVEGWLESMNGFGLERATLARRQTTLRSFAKWGLRKRYWHRDPLGDVETISVPERLPRPFSPDERDALMGLPLMDEERALRALLYYGGPRDAEVCGIRLGDFRGPSVRDDGTISAARVRILGKGNKERTVSLHDDCWRAVESFVALRAKEDRTPDAYLFTHRLGDPWTPRMIVARVKRWGKLAGVAHCTPHRFRHTFVTDQLDATDGDIRIVQEQAGHANIATTAGYAKVADRRKDAAAQKMKSYDAVIPPSYPSAPAAPEVPADNPAESEAKHDAP